MNYSRLLCFATALVPTVVFGRNYWPKPTDSSRKKTFQLPPELYLKQGIDPYRHSLKDTRQEKIDHQYTWYGRVNVMDRQFYDGLQSMLLASTSRMIAIGARKKLWESAPDRTGFGQDYKKSSF